MSVTYNCDICGEKVYKRVKLELDDSIYQYDLCKDCASWLSALLTTNKKRKPYGN